jgi:CDGSH-type Zn-finger protein
LSQDPAIITPRDDGPYLVKGNFKVVDATGKEFPAGEVIALCRCGHSANKPFCDGKHKPAEFKDAARA